MPHWRRSFGRLLLRSHDDEEQLSLDEDGTAAAAEAGEGSGDRTDDPEAAGEDCGMDQASFKQSFALPGSKR